MAESVADPFELKEHNTDVFTYESHLKGSEGLFIARTKNDKTLTLKDVCVSAKERGGFTGSLEDLIEHSDIIMREVVSRVRDGYGVNMAGIIELHLNVGGTLKDPYDKPDPVENKLSLRVRRLHGAARLVQGIHVVNWGLAPASARIDELIDSATGAVNDVVTRGKPATITGKNIRIEGTSKPDDEIGVGFYTPGPPETTVWMMEPLVVNEKSRIVIVVPHSIPGEAWYVKIRTRYSGGGAFLKETREIISGFTVQAAPPARTDDSSGPSR
ncbi:MAG: DUF4469 domain-containing protein [Spirochaetaceae bacterium]|jgi:hypothetical protein|nr:DUF4469 domain-containing protein [Spirochaetaceae bacterium]